MTGLLAAAACAVAIEAAAAPAAPAHARGAAPALSLRLRPACPAQFGATRAAVSEALARGAGEREITLHFGRLAAYPWLAALLARQASSSRQWREGVEPDDYVRRALLGMPEFTVLVDPPWRIESLAVAEVRLRAARELDLAQGAPVPPDRLLPYDAQVTLRLSR